MNKKIDDFFPYSIIILVITALLLQYHYYQNELLKLKKIQIIQSQNKIFLKSVSKTKRKYISHKKTKYFSTPVFRKRNIQSNLVSAKKKNIKVNINTASYEELLKIPYIGPKKAKEIIRYRIIHRGFKNINELKKIKGIGEKTLQKIKNYIEL